MELSDVTADIAAGSQISFTVEQVRGPPSTAKTSGFLFNTRSVALDVID